MENDPRHREIIHLDLDAFYASVEVSDNPDLSGKPVIVGGGEKRGVVTAASYEARKFGVHSAQPVATARRLCPDGVFLPVRMSRYKEMSDRVFEIFRRFSPLVEALSIDEAFLDVTGTDRLFGGALEIARKIKAAVAAETGLTVSAGVAASKFVAKIASDMHKPDGLTVVPRGKEKEFLGPLPVGKLWGVGKVTETALHRMGVKTIGDLASVPAETLRKKFGEHGPHLHRIANGIDDREVEPEHEVKSIGHEDTYDEDIRDGKEIEKELLSLAHRVSSRLRRKGFRGRTVTLKVKYHNFTQVTRAATMPFPTDDGATIYRTVLPLLKKTEAGRRPVRLLGISVSHFGEKRSPREEWGQIPLFGKRPELRSPSSRETPERDPARTAKLNEAVDRIREKYGEKGIRPGTLAGDD
ncbi:MAG: DNA polymerase IV [Candidatus Deferrimicrobiaceae bacterium]